MAKQPMTTCHLCGELLEGGVSREHVPPKQFFPKSLRQRDDLLTVPTHCWGSQAVSRPFFYGAARRKPAQCCAS